MCVPQNIHIGSKRLLQELLALQVHLGVSMSRYKRSILMVQVNKFKLQQHVTYELLWVQTVYIEWWCWCWLCGPMCSLL